MRLGAAAAGAAACASGIADEQTEQGIHESWASVTEKCRPALWHRRRFGSDRSRLATSAANAAKRPASMAARIRAIKRR